jgi:NADH-quinone oxidoreductase subunit J
LRTAGMDVTVTSLLALGVVIVLSACGVLLSRDNLYAALYMTVALILIATTYAVFNLQPVFILIAFVFVGAIGAVTIALAATYRITLEEFPVEKLWIIPIIITIAAVCYTIYAYVETPLEKIYSIDELLAEFPSDYLLLVTFLISLMILLMLSVVKFVRREEAWK